MHTIVTGSLEQSNHLKDLDVNGRIIFKPILDDINWIEVDLNTV